MVKKKIFEMAKIILIGRRSTYALGLAHWSERTTMLLPGTSKVASREKKGP